MPSRDTVGRRRPIQKWSQRQFLRVYGVAYAILDGFLSAGTEKQSATIRVIDGDVPAGAFRDLCIFAHFDRQGRVDDHVLHYLHHLRRAGREVIFVTNSADLSDPCIERVRPFCSAIIIRENKGYDFGSWKAGIQQSRNLDFYDTVILANDSVYGPIGDLGEKITHMRQRGLDFWGITDSYEVTHHVQSYFLFFENRVVTSQAFRAFWAGLPLYRFKWSVIWNGEIGLSQRLVRAGFRMGALCGYDDLRKRHGDILKAEEAKAFGGRVNVSRVLWKLLIRDYGCPFLKVDIVREQPDCALEIGDWAAFVKGHADYDTELIHNHLARVRGA
ncbi:rhamnan synthesis F family protein [Actibacterium sp. MT2.3-13A]|uniref:rhamnan synthesis F family protein n=1 Tax=Actibacterium sp. MT2.3-13A TaxID=2828332 RepID=UPI001BA593D5|nr:rhamnan synthesis F family protein [Actibacterium sp. MT2.3-13A]